MHRMSPRIPRHLAAAAEADSRPTASLRSSKADRTSAARAVRPVWTSASTRSGVDIKSHGSPDRTASRDSLGRLERRDGVVRSSSARARNPSGSEGLRDELRRPNQRRRRVRPAQRSARLDVPSRRLHRARTAAAEAASVGSSVSRKRSSASLAAAIAGLPTARRGTRALKAGAGSAGGRGGTPPRAGSPTPDRDLSRHVVLLEPDQRPGDPQGVRVTVRRLGGGSGGSESRVASTFPSGGGPAHAQATRCTSSCSPSGSSARARSTSSAAAAASSL